MGGAARFRIYRLGPSAGQAHWSDAALEHSHAKAPVSFTGLGHRHDLDVPAQLSLNCSSGVAEDCFAAGVVWQSNARQSEGGRGAPAATSMRKEAIDAFTRGCELSEMRSCSWLASELEWGKHAGRDLPRSLALHEKACTLGYAPGCNSAARMVERSDTDRAVTLYVRACDLDDPDGCFVAARLLAAGEGVVADTDRALALFSRACDDGMAPACLRAASLSPTEADEFKRRACVLGGDGRVPC
jgi:TPR repeat protein